MDENTNFLYGAKTGNAALSQVWDAWEDSKRVLLIPIPTRKTLHF